MKGVESVIESMVSSYEHKFNKSSNVSESTAAVEMEISVNGPALPKCQSLVRKALNKYFIEHKKMKRWHFTCNLMPGELSTAMKTHQAKQSKFPCMEHLKWSSSDFI